MIEIFFGIKTLQFIEKGFDNLDISRKLNKI
jgi:hypothetical protein